LHPERSTGEFTAMTQLSKAYRNFAWRGTVDSI